MSVQNVNPSPLDLESKWPGHAPVLTVLFLFVYSMWGFLHGCCPSTEFARLHFAFDHAYTVLAGDGVRIPATFKGPGSLGSRGEADLTFSPFGLDFLLTYLLTRLSGVDHGVSLVRVDAWRMLVLNVVFAFGCRRWAREVLQTRAAATFVFAISLFAGGALLLHSPSLLLGSVFVPWMLWYMTKVSREGPEHMLRNGAGLACIIAASESQLFSIRPAPVWWSLLAYGLGLLVAGYGRGLRLGLEAAWRDRRRRALLLVVVAAPIVSALLLAGWNAIPLVSPDTPHNPREAIDHVPGATGEDGESSAIGFHPITLFFGYPNPSGHTGSWESGTETDPQYPSALGGILVLMGLFRGRNAFRLPIAVGAGILLAAGALVPDLWRSILLVPFIALLAGMGMEAILPATHVERSRGEQIRLILLTVGLALAGVLMFAVAMIIDSDFGTRHQGLLLSLLFLGFAGLAVSGHINLPDQSERGRAKLFLIIAMLDFLTFLHVVSQTVVRGGELSAGGHGLFAGQSMLFAHSVALVIVVYAVQLITAAVWLRETVIRVPAPSRGEEM